MDTELLLLLPDYPLLNIHDRKGLTGYIDFIHINEITNSIMTGIDCYNRPFFTLTVDLYYSDDTIVSTFTTFFKRYIDSTSHLWHACNSGSYIPLFNTCGGMNKKQFSFLCLLLQDKFYYFNRIKKENNEENNEKEEENDYLKICANYNMNDKELLKAIVYLHDDKKIYNKIK